MEVNDGVIPQLPAGHLAIFELDGDGRPTNCDTVRLVDLTGLAEIAPDDPGPEFVAVNSDNIVVVTLQENNHIALVDLATGTVTAHFAAAGRRLLAGFGRRRGQREPVAATSRRAASISTRSTPRTMA